MIKIVNGKKVIVGEKSWLVDDRYEIYKDNGTIYDTEKAKDIPENIFKIADKLMAK